jgi:hypothetical protein
MGVVMSDARVLPQSVEQPPHYDPADASIPRTRVVKEFEGDPGPCPRCSGALRQHYHTYLVVTRHRDKPSDAFMLSGDYGWFCLDCPTVVLQKQEVEDALQGALFRWDVGDHYAVTGLVDLDAVPEDRRDLPLGDDDNPIPLVEFTNLRQSRRTPSRRSRVAEKAKAKRKRQKKARRRSRRR